MSKQTYISQDGFMKQSCQFCCHGPSEQHNFPVSYLVIPVEFANIFRPFRNQVWSCDI